MFRDKFVKIDKMPRHEIVRQLNKAYKRVFLLI